MPCTPSSTNRAGHLWACPGHPRLNKSCSKKDVDGRERRQVYVVCAKQTTMPGHDGGRLSFSQCTAVKNREPRKPESQVHTGWLRMPRSQEPTTASARPTRLSIGNSPTPPSRTGTRLSAELSRLSPITNTRSGGTVTSGVLSSRPLSRSLKIAWLTPLGKVST